MKRKTITIGIISIILFVIVFSIIPWLKIGVRGYICRLCGAEKGTKKIYIFSMHVWSSTSRIHKNDLTKIYNENIGLQHEHQWAAGGSGISHYTLLGRWLFTHGGFNVKPYPKYQSELTETSLHAVDQVKNWPKEKKISLYNNILTCTERNEFEEIRRIYNSTIVYRKGIRRISDTIDPNQIWTDWLIKQKSKNIQPATPE